ncbi:putative sulfate transporter 3.3 [Sesamum angolense]|uniref:Sulfate transporter 3.3 n=1 Tax=Sesamum angolense TaxID=2727404 RepID=A0AAE1XDC7_9LAMI|nr:putative sulfate transporter 3.3 [Sesamum angolense]
MANYSHGICFLVFLLLTRHISMKKPKLFWVSAGAPLLSVILSTLLVFAFKAQNHGISVIGKLQEGLNPPSWNMLHFHGSYLGLVMKTGLVTGIISLTEGIAVGRTFAALKNYQVDGNKEMIAIGLMNIVGSSTSCYVTTGAFSRSAVNHNAGCKTAVSNIIMAVTVMVTLLFLMPLFQYTPNVVLGAIIVTAVVGLVDIPAACQIWKIDKFDFLVMLYIYRNLHHYKEAVSVPGFLILSIEAPINFANTTYLKERITRWIEEYETEDANAKKKSGVKFVILDLSAVSAIDTNGVSFFKDLKMALEKKNLEAIGEVIEKLQRADDAKELARPDCLFLTVGEAVTSLVSTVKSHSSNYRMLYISCLAIALSNAGGNIGTGSDLPYRIAVLPEEKVLLIAQSYRPDGKFLVSTGSRPGRIWTVKESTSVASLPKENDEVFGFCRFSRTTETDLVLLSQQCDVSLLSYISVQGNVSGNRSFEFFSTYTEKRWKVEYFSMEKDKLNTHCPGSSFCFKCITLGELLAMNLSSASPDSSARVTCIKDKKRDGTGMWIILFIILPAVTV